MLSRYIALILRGQRALPENYALLARQDEALARDHYFLSPDLNTLVDYNAFLESVAQRIGCEPKLPIVCLVVFNLHAAITIFLTVHMLGQPFGSACTKLAVLLWLASTAFMIMYKGGLLIKWLIYPHWSVWYRQRGPGSKPELLLSMLGRVVLWKAKAWTQSFALNFLWSAPNMYVQRLLSVPIFLLTQSLSTLGLQFWEDRFGGDRLLRPQIFALHSCEWRFPDLFAHSKQ